VGEGVGGVPGAGKKGGFRQQKKGGFRLVKKGGFRLMQEYGFLGLDMSISYMRPQ
jgi:hypothetical protein